jgi:hypothetical protein
MSAPQFIILVRDPANAPLQVVPTGPPPEDQSALIAQLQEQLAVLQAKLDAYVAAVRVDAQHLLELEP